MEETRTTAKKMILQDKLNYDGQMLLSYKIEYPQFQSKKYQTSLAAVNRFYRDKALKYQKRLKEELFPQAVKDYKFSVKNGYPVHAYEALVVYKLTYNRNRVISLYFDQYEYTGGAHGSTVRSSQTWNLKKPRRFRLGDLFGCSLDFKKAIIKTATRQIKKQPSIYFEDYEKLLADTFNEESFYCTPAGIIFYYQQYDIAPYSSGIREFLIPYSECVHNPVKLCSAK